MMQPTDFLIAAALTAAMSAPALAQTTTAPTLVGETRSNWMASGFAGTNFGGSTDGVVDVDVDNGPGGRRRFEPRLRGTGGLLVERPLRR